MDHIQSSLRTHSCGQLRAEHIGQTVRLAGFLENLREVGSNLAFLVLRDFYGVTQVVLETEELVRAVTGEGITPRHLVRYLGERYGG